MQYYIYKITNKINGKSYVGQHKVYPGEAFTRYMGKGIAIRLAIQKYGKENFSKEILEEIDDDEKHEFTSERERHWITKLNTMQPNGYNLSPGGEGGCTPEAAKRGAATRRVKGTDRKSKATRLKMSEAAKGKHFSDEHKKHLSDNHRLKTEHVILFQDGHIETTTEALTSIAKRFGTTQNRLLRKSAKGQFINGIMLQGIQPNQYACCDTISPKYKKSCKDPIKHDMCSFYALYQRKRKHPEQYANIDIEKCIIKGGT